MVRIIADSTCDLSKELIERYDIDIVPLHIHLGEEEYLDGMNITPDEIYAWSNANNTTPKTSAASITDVISVYEKYPEDEIIIFSISGSMSTTGNVMRLAAEDLEREDQIHIIDSKNLSTGIGLMVLEAARMAKEGMAAADIVEAINAMIPNVRASFVVDTLTFLHRGGRCSGIAALAGGALKLHPQLNVIDGAMVPGKKYRGNMSKVILSYVGDMTEDLKAAKKNRVFITHSGCEQEILDEVYAYLKELNHFEEICITRAGGVISSHCGPGTLGVLFIAE